MTGPVLADGAEPGDAAARPARGDAAVCNRGMVTAIPRLHTNQQRHFRPAAPDGSQGVPIRLLPTASPRCYASTSWPTIHRGQRKLVTSDIPRRPPAIEAPTAQFQRAYSTDGRRQHAASRRFLRRPKPNARSFLADKTSPHVDEIPFLATAKAAAAGARHGACVEGPARPGTDRGQTERPNATRADLARHGRRTPPTGEPKISIQRSRK
jgi:hypothetical protein